MFIEFFLRLRAAGVPVSLREFLLLQQAMQAGLAEQDVDQFYYLSRATLVKNETHIDRFDQVFAHCFKGDEALPFKRGPAMQTVTLPEEWLRKMTEQVLTDEEKAMIEAMGGFDELMKALAQQLAKQTERHEGGSKAIGTAGTSPFGAHGTNPEGVRIGQKEGRNRSAVKVWDKREFRNLDGSVELGTRNIKVALRRLRRFAREGAQEELDLSGTIGATARNAGYLDLKMQPERHNSIKILLCLDIGGSMDDHIKICEELFSAAKAEFKHLVHLYFHNCPYDQMWKDARFRKADSVPMEEMLRTYDARWKVIFVGDASMSPYELIQPGGAVSSWNTDSGQVCLQRMLDHFPKSVWLNPVHERSWDHTQTIRIIRDQIEDRMFPLTLDGLDRAMHRLMR